MASQPQPQTMQGPAALNGILNDLEVRLRVARYAADSILESIRKIAGSEPKLLDTVEADIHAKEPPRSGLVAGFDTALLDLDGVCCTLQKADIELRRIID